MPLPRQPAPALVAPTVFGAPWRLSDQRPESFTMVVFYRGAHCPLCGQYLRKLEEKLPEFRLRGVTVVAASMDSAERAESSYRDWGLIDLPVAYNLGEAQARAWGLYLSSARSEKEPEVFSEPGVYLIRPDGEIFFAQTQSAPFTRPDLDQLLAGIDFTIANDYPARGELAPEADQAQAAA